MKKIILLPFLVIGIIQAADTNSVQTMQNLEIGMSSIQKGLMYNDRAMVEKGVKSIQKNTENIAAFDIKNEKGRSFKVKEYSHTESRAIYYLAEDMLKGYDRGDKNRVLDTYRKIQNRCMICHNIVRKW